MGKLYGLRLRQKRFRSRRYRAGRIQVAIRNGYRYVPTVPSFTYIGDTISMFPQKPGRCRVGEAYLASVRCVSKLRGALLVGVRAVGAPLRGAFKAPHSRAGNRRSD